VDDVKKTYKPNICKHLNGFEAYYPTTLPVAIYLAKIVQVSATVAAQ
jgi:hypothetical protein